MPYQLHLLLLLLGSESAGLDAVVLFDYREEQDRLRTGKSSIPSVQMQLCIYCEWAAHHSHACPKGCIYIGILILNKVRY